jgi:hypothetical protein
MAQAVFAGGRGQEQHSSIGLAQQTAPGRVLVDQLMLAGRLVGQQIHHHAMQLGLVNHGRQSVIVRSDQQMLTCMALGQAADVQTHGLQHHITGLGPAPSKWRTIWSCGNWLSAASVYQ